MKTQNQQIKEYLEAGNKITSLEALNMFGCLRLASRISDLKKQGLDIKTDMVLDPNTRKQYASYRLVREKKIVVSTDFSFPVKDGNLF